MQYAIARLQTPKVDSYLSSLQAAREIGDRQAAAACRRAIDAIQAGHQPTNADVATIDSLWGASR